MKAKTKTIAFISVIVIMLLASCQSTPWGYVNSFERFVERVERNASSYSKEQWSKNDEQLQKFVDKYETEKQKLSSEEKRKVGELTARYYKARVKAKGVGIFDELNGWLEYLKGFGNEIIRDIDDIQN